MRQLFKVIDEQGALVNSITINITQGAATIEWSAYLEDFEITPEIGMTNETATGRGHLISVDLRDMPAGVDAHSRTRLHPTHIVIGNNMTEDDVLNAAWTMGAWDVKRHKGVYTYRPMLGGPDVRKMQKHPDKTLCPYTFGRKGLCRRVDWDKKGVAILGLPQNPVTKKTPKHLRATTKQIAYLRRLDPILDTSKMTRKQASQAIDAAIKKQGLK
jgi:hypothetical protein